MSLVAGVFVCDLARTLYNRVHIFNHLLLRVYSLSPSLLYVISRSKSVNLDGSINNPTMHGNFTNIPIDLGSEWLYDDTELKGKIMSCYFLTTI